MASEDFFFKVRASLALTPPFLSTFDTDIEKCTSDIFFSTAGASLEHRGATLLRGAAPGPIRAQNGLAFIDDDDDLEKLEHPLTRSQMYSFGAQAFH